MGLLLPGTHLGERREWLAAWLGNQAFLPQCGKVEVGVFWSRLGYIMLLRGVPGPVTEEGFQEAGRRMLDR